MSTTTAAAATTAAHAPVNTITTTQRYVPGAPPSAPLSKTQKKKKKAGAKGDETEATAGGEATTTDAALITSAPKAGADTDLAAKPEDVAAAAIASEAAAEVVSDHITGLLNGVGTGPKKTSAVVELVNKRYRALTKKIQRIKEYSSKPVETLNEDQKRTLSTLPILEASARELEDVRKAIEVHEAEEAVHETRRLAEIEAVVKQRIAEAVDNTRSTTVSHAVELVQIVRVLSELPASETVNHAQQVLLTKDVGADSFESYVKLFLTGQGDYAALTAALKEHLNPAAPAPAAAAEEEEAKQEEDEEAEAEEPTPPPVTGVPSMASSFHFMQDDELQTPFEEGAEWVQHPEGAEQPTIKTEAAEPESLDWAAEDHADLPPIESLHQGVSGDATPVPPVSALPEEAATAESYGGDAEHYDAHAAVHSHAPAPAGPQSTKKGPEVDADGFVNIPTKSRRGFGDGWRGGRGEHRGEHRGRGGYRGGRGEWRGGHREGGGGHREGGHREGGHREGGHREGGHREGGEGSGSEHRGRGEWRGRARGEGRGEWRGRGEYRGRGDRGGYRGRPNEAAAPPPAAA